MMDRVDHDPEHLQLERQRLEGSPLALYPGAVTLNQVKTLLAIAGRLHQSALEVVERLRPDPGVVFREGRDAFAHEIRREQLSQRRRNGIYPGFGLAEGHVGFGGQSHAGEDVTLVLHFLARNSHRFSQPDPHLDASAASYGAVVVQDALDPLAAHLGNRAVRNDGCVFPWNRTLIGQTVGHPALELRRAELPRVHPLVERVAGIVRRAERAQSVRQRVTAERSIQVGEWWPWWSSQLGGVECNRHGITRKSSCRPLRP